MNSKNIKLFALNIRKNIIFTAYKAGHKSAHIGGALSIADIFAVLYSEVLNLKKTKILDENRDRLILSKGHACLALYSALVQKNFLKKKELETFESDNSDLLGHPIINKLKGIEFSTGSLGMGLSLGIGTAIAAKRKKKKYRVFVVLGDGECNEGSVWEAVLCACHYKLNNLFIIVDRNNFQQTGENKFILDLKNLKKKFNSFGCKTKEIDGHNIKEIFNSLISKSTNKPTAIIANTIKGKGVKIFEKDNNWHHSIITKSIYQNIIKNL